MWKQISSEEFVKKIKGGTALEDRKEHIEGRAASVIRLIEDGRSVYMAIRPEGKEMSTFWVRDDEGARPASTEDIRGRVE